MEDKNLWWGYKNVSGTLQAKRYFGRQGIIEAVESDFIEQIVFPFPANTREEALEYIARQVS